MEALSWVKCQGNVWCPLKTVNLTNVTARGVYIIWYRGKPGRVVYVGRGIIADRLNAHRRDDEIMAYDQRHTLLATWAKVPPPKREGIELYLYQRWNPLVGKNNSKAEPIPVYAPWAPPERAR